MEQAPSAVCAKYVTKIGAQKEWALIEPGISLWEAALLEWAARNGEIRNYQPLCAHYDGNKNHTIESYTVFGKLCPGDHRESTEEVANMVPGIIALPMQGIGLEFRAGRDVGQLHFGHTIHVADPSRGVCNYSIVHGSHKTK